ncbi:MAG: hypothetical protein BWY45_02183 [Euryarchaeota archaeon ADurb.Bin294]|nr:MAG: hypothetical protein BWY45_02183 [Euryarchaeota archaeon ADurb.Bin294]
MRGEKKSPIDLKGASIPILSQNVAFLIPSNSRELKLRLDGRNTLREGVF